MNQWSKKQADRILLIRAYLADHPGADSVAIGRALGIPSCAVRRAWKKPGVKTGVPQEPKDGEAREVCTEILRTPPTLDQLIADCAIDLTREFVERHVVNKFEQGSKHPETGAVSVVPLYQIKAWLKPVPGAKEADIVRDTIEWIRANSPVNPAKAPAKMATVQVDDPVMLELSVPDLHYGRLCHTDETPSSYDVKIAAHIHQQAIEALYTRASIFPIQKIMLVISGDFFNVDNDKNETTAGTPQSEDSRWAKSFRQGVALLHRAIEFLRSKAEVEVRFIGGNHDRTRLFYAGEVVAAMYANAAGVTVINQPRVRQYTRWGTVLLGFAHGDGAKHDKLPLLMASESGDLWSGASHREIHVGHLHHSRETQFHAGNEHNAVRVRVLPSLAAVDTWHMLHGFVGQKRAAEAYLWGRKCGAIGSFTWSPP